MGVYLSRKHQAVKIEPEDNLAIATKRIFPGGESAALDKRGPAQTMIVLKPIASNHKIALKNMLAGYLAIKYGRAIGQAAKPLGGGRRVHIT